MSDLDVAWQGLEHEPWLHVYGQYQWHSPATMRGTRAALEALRSAIDRALTEGTSSCSVTATDGEGYDVKIEMVNLVSAVGSPEYIMLGENAAADREHARAERHRLYMLGYAFVPVPR